MSRCAEKGCINYATFGDKCVNHKDPKDITVLPDKDFEIVPISAVPVMNIRNERNHKIARTIGSLQEGHALKVRANGHSRYWPKAMVDLCRKLGIRAHYRATPSTFYFWKGDIGKQGKKP